MRWRGRWGDTGNCYRARGLMEIFWYHLRWFLLYSENIWKLIELYMYFIPFICACVCTYSSAHECVSVKVLQHACESQRTTLRNHFSPSTTRVPGSVVTAFTTELSCHLELHILSELYIDELQLINKKEYNSFYCFQIRLVSSGAGL